MVVVLASSPSSAAGPSSTLLLVSPARSASLSAALFVILLKGSESVGEKDPRGSPETVNASRHPVWT